MLPRRLRRRAPRTWPGLPRGPARPAQPPATGPPEGPTAGPTAAANPLPALPPLAAGTPVEVVTGPRTRPQLALTFHGQGDPAIAEAVLRQPQHGTRLTVLVVGSWLDERPPMSRRIC